MPVCVEQTFFSSLELSLWSSRTGHFLPTFADIASTIYAARNLLSWFLKLLEGLGGTQWEEWSFVALMLPCWNQVEGKETGTVPVSPWFSYVSVGVGVGFFTFYPNTSQKFNICPQDNVAARAFPSFPERETIPWAALYHNSWALGHPIFSTLVASGTSPSTSTSTIWKDDLNSSSWLIKHISSFFLI